MRYNADGELLNITLVAYEQRPGLVIMQPVVATALRSVGFNVTEVTTPGDSWWLGRWRVRGRRLLVYSRRIGCRP